MRSTNAAYRRVRRVDRANTKSPAAPTARPRKSVRYRYELIAMAPHLLEVAQSLTKLKDAYPGDDNEPQFDFD